MACVVVWEWRRGAWWVPHAAGVTRTLERAHHKQLTRVVLADADPALLGHHVNLRTLTQVYDAPEGGSMEWRVRRACYDVTSVGARGLRWDWAPLPPAAARRPHYEPLPMEMQCAIEAAWAAGVESLWLGGWSVSVARGVARGGAQGGGVRLLRRGTHPPYPRGKQAAPHALVPTLSRGPTPPSRPPRALPALCAPPCPPAACPPYPAAPPCPAGPPAPRSVSPPRKQNLARQILHNLNIFSTSHKLPEGGAAEPEAARRHSVDTVSTYLSHESKDSLQRGSVGELLDCSAGSDDVFEAPPSPCPRPSAAAPPPPPPPARSPPPSPPPTIGDHHSLMCLPNGPAAETWGSEGSQWGGEGPQWGGEGPQWGAVCPPCLRALRAGAPLPVLRAPARDELYVECLVCGNVPDEECGEALPNGGTLNGLGSLGTLGSLGPQGQLSPLGDVSSVGPQPPGSMCWSVGPQQLPPYRAPTITVTYSFQSGRQAPGHPAPGAPYYAVGFPRHSLLPDTPLGRLVLAALVSAWRAGVLFGVGASRTTGREHVVAWRGGGGGGAGGGGGRALPPPAAAPHYPRQQPAADAMLRALLHSLRELVAADG